MLVRKIAAAFPLNLLDLFGLEIRRQTPKDRFFALMASLWPWNSQFDLERIGGSGDGTYLIPKCISGEEILISPGVGSSALFEIDLFEKYGVPAILLDRSVQAPKNLPESFIFERKWLNTYDDESNASLDGLMRKFSPGKKFLVQMDIEGSEYSILRSIRFETFERIKLLVIEFHHLSYWKNLIHFENSVEPAIKRVLDYYYPVHLKQNSAVKTFKFGKYTFADAIEVTFLAKTEMIPKGRVNSLPHTLDVLNSKNSKLLDFPRL